jgi:hypothetical protein
MVQAQFRIKVQHAAEKQKPAIPEKFKDRPNVTSCAGNNGQLFVCWQEAMHLSFQKSKDGGKTWLADTKTIVPVTYHSPKSEVTGAPVITCDQSKGPFHGRLYVCWSDEKNGVNDKDVFLVYSDDAGENWTEPILVTYRPNHKEQFNPAMTVDQNTDRLYVAYFDRQNYIEPGYTDLYLAISDNGGLLFNSYKINPSPVSVNARLTTSILATAPHTAKIFWAECGKKSHSFSASVNDSLLEAYNRLELTKELSVEKTITFSDTLTLNFNSGQPLALSAVIYKPLEPTFEKLVFKHKVFAAGSNRLLINTGSLNLKRGNYVLCLYYNNRNTYVWIVED